MIKPLGCYVALRVLAAATALAMVSNTAAWAAAESSTSSAPATTAGLVPEVTVTGRRAELEKRVSRFVNQIAALENGDEGLARWQVPPACPLVSGLPRQEGEFILARLSEIAHSAGIPLGDEHCRPNLYILVTDQPEDLLKAMEKRNRAFTFGYNSSLRAETPASVIDAFIDTPLAVRAWYNSAEKDAWGQPLSYCPAADLVAIECASNATPGLLGTPASLQSECNNPHFDPGKVYECGRAVAGGSHLVLNNVWWLSRVFLIVDKTRLQGVTIGQLADYVAMAGFAKLKPVTRMADAPTILKLFDATAQSAPTGMTEWDQAFLKSLYATAQKLRLQRSQIARAMVREIVP